MPDKIKDGFDRRFLSSVILLNHSAKVENRLIFYRKIVVERLNSGGEKYAPQETRNAPFVWFNK